MYSLSGPRKQKESYSELDSSGSYFISGDSDISCTRARSYTRVCARARTRTYTPTHTHPHPHTHTHTHTHSLTHSLTHTHINTRARARTRVCSCAYVLTRHLVRLHKRRGGGGGEREREREREYVRMTLGSFDQSTLFLCPDSNCSMSLTAPLAALTSRGQLHVHDRQSTPQTLWLLMLFLLVLALVMLITRHGYCPSSAHLD